MQAKIFGWLWVFISCCSLEGCAFLPTPRTPHTPFSEGWEQGCEEKRRGGSMAEQTNAGDSRLDAAFALGWSRGFASCYLAMKSGYPYDTPDRGDPFQALKDMQEASDRDKAWKKKVADCPPEKRKSCLY